MLWLLAIVGVALVIRVAYLIQLQSDPLLEYPTLDAKVHHEWASEFAAGREWSVDRNSGEPIAYFRAPLYVWFLGTVYKVFGADPGIAPRLIQCLIGAFSCGLVFLLGRQVFGRRIGIVAGFSAAAYWTLVYFDNELLLVPLLVFLDLALLLLLVLAYEKRTWKLWALAGFVTGLSAIARPNILLFGVFVCAWILILARREGSTWRHGMAGCLAYGICLLIPIAPIAIRNHVIGNDLVLISSQGGVNFYIGNNPRSDGVMAVVPGTPRDWWGGYHATKARAARALGHDPKSSEVSQYFFSESMNFWKETPLDALSLTALKIRLYFNRQEFANNKCLYTFTEEFTPIIGWLPIGIGIVGPLGILGLILGCLKYPMRTFPLWGFFTSYSASTIIFFVTARYRMPVVPVLIICSVFALAWSFEQIRQRSYRSLVPAGASLALLILLFFYLPQYGFGELVKQKAQSYWTLTNRLSVEGTPEEALYWADRTISHTRAELDKGIDGRKKGRRMRFYLLAALAKKGGLLEKQGEYAASMTAYREAIESAPPFVTKRIGSAGKLARIRAETEERKALEGYRKLAREAYAVMWNERTASTGRRRARPTR